MMVHAEVFMTLTFPSPTAFSLGGLTTKVESCLVVACCVLEAGVCFVSRALLRQFCFVSGVGIIFGCCDLEALGLVCPEV